MKEENNNEKRASRKLKYRSVGERWGDNTSQDLKVMKKRVKEKRRRNERVKEEE